MKQGAGKFLRWLGVTLLAAGLVGEAFAFTPPGSVISPDRDPLFQIGGGVSVDSNDEDPVGVYFRVRFPGLAAGDHFLFARLEGDLSINKHGVNYADVRMIGMNAGGRFDVGDAEITLAAQFGNLTFQRNVSIFNGYFASIELFAIEGKVDVKLAEKVRMEIGLVLNLVGLSIAQNFEGNMMRGVTHGGQFDLSIIIDERVRIGVSQHLDWMRGPTTKRGTGEISCGTAYDANDNPYESCSEIQVLVESESIMISRTSLEVAVDLARGLQAFARGDIFVMKSDVIRGETEYFNDVFTGFQFILGLTGSF